MPCEHLHSFLSYRENVKIWSRIKLNGIFQLYTVERQVSIVQIGPLKISFTLIRKHSNSFVVGSLLHVAAQQFIVDSLGEIMAFIQQKAK